MSQESYKYTVHDRSILLPYYKKYLWDPLLRHIPPSVSPNSLSILANVGSLASFIVLLALPPEESWWFLLPAVGTFAYLCLDNMDGTHARRTQQTSPLGEFIDHWFDAFNTGFLTLGLYYGGRLQPELILVIVALTNVAYFATMWEQRHTGQIQFGRGGQVEGVTLQVLIYLAFAIFGQEAMAKTPIALGLTVLELTGLTLVFSFAVTVWYCVSRTRRAFAEWLPLLVVMAVVLAWYFFGELGFFPAAFLLLLVNTALAGRMIIARVLRKSYHPMEWPLFGLLLAGFAASRLFELPRHVQPVLGWTIVAYLLARLAYEFITTVHALRRFVRPGEFLERALLLRRGSGRVR